MTPAPVSSLPRGVKSFARCPTDVYSRGPAIVCGRLEATVVPRRDHRAAVPRIIWGVSASNAPSYARMIYDITYPVTRV